jgi:hypothetical protein
VKVLLRFDHINPWFNLDALAKRLKTSFSVIPAEAGIQFLQGLLDSRLRGSDDLGASCKAVTLQ